MSRLVGGAGFCAGMCAMIALAGAPRALAQSDDDRAGARSAATEGVAAFNQEHYAEAADLFMRAESLVHSPVQVLFLARAQAKLGQLVKARENYNRISREHLTADAPEAFRKAQVSARDEVQAIEPRIASVTIKLVGATAQQVTVTIDNEKIPAALIGPPRPVDPGKHEFKAVGDGLVSDPASLSVAEGGRGEVTINVHASTTGGSAATDTTAPAAGAVAAPVESGRADASTSGGPPVDAAPGDKKLMVPAIVAFGVGAIGLGVGTVFLIKAHSSRKKADDLCPNNQCLDANRSEVNSDDSDANSASTIGVIGLAAGGVGLAAGITLLVLNHSKSDAAHADARPALYPWFSLGSAGVAGRF